MRNKNTKNRLLINPEFNHGSMTPYWIYVICSSIAAVIISVIFRNCREATKHG